MDPRIPNTAAGHEGIDPSTGPLSTDTEEDNTLTGLVDATSNLDFSRPDIPQKRTAAAAFENNGEESGDDDDLSRPRPHKLERRRGTKCTKLMPKASTPGTGIEPAPVSPVQGLEATSEVTTQPEKEPSMKRKTVDCRKRRQIELDLRTKLCTLIDQDILDRVDAEGGITLPGRMYKAVTLMMERMRGQGEGGSEVESLRAVNTALRALRADNRALRADNMALAADNRALRADNMALRATIANAAKLLKSS